MTNARTGASAPLVVTRFAICPWIKRLGELRGWESGEWLAPPIAFGENSLLELRTIMLLRVVEIAKQEPFIDALRYANRRVASKVAALSERLESAKAFELSHSDRQTINTALGYLWRSAFNPIPFGLFAGTHIGGVGCGAGLGTLRCQIADQSVQNRSCVLPDHWQPECKTLEWSSNFDIYQQTSSTGFSPMGSDATHRIDVFAVGGDRAKGFPGEVEDVIRRYGSLRIRRELHQEYVGYLKDVMWKPARTERRDGVENFYHESIGQLAGNADSSAHADFDAYLEGANELSDIRLMDPIGLMVNDLRGQIDAGAASIRADGVLLKHCEGGASARVAVAVRKSAKEEPYSLSFWGGGSNSFFGRSITAAPYCAASIDKLRQWHARWPDELDISVPARTMDDYRVRLTKEIVHVPTSVEARADYSGIHWRDLELDVSGKDWKVTCPQLGEIQPVHLGVASRFMLPQRAQWLLSLPLKPMNGVECILRAFNRCIAQAFRSGERVSAIPELHLGDALLLSPRLAVLWSHEVAELKLPLAHSSVSRLRDICYERLGCEGVVELRFPGEFGRARYLDLRCVLGLDQLVRMMRVHPVAFLCGIDMNGAEPAKEWFTEFGFSRPLEQ